MYAGWDRQGPREIKRDPTGKKVADKQAGEAAGRLVWVGFALPYLLLCRASQIWAHDSGLVHSELCLTGGDVMFRNVAARLAWADCRHADSVELFRASKVDQKRVGASVIRTRSVEGGKGWGARDILLEILEMHPEFKNQASLMQAIDRTQAKLHVISHAEATTLPEAAG